MATTNQIKFYKGGSYPSTPVAGMIFFNTSDHSIYVYNGAKWERYAGLVDAAWNESKHELVITTAKGDTITVNDLASASAMAASLKTVNDTLASHDTRINTAQAAAEAAQGEVDALEGVVAGVKATADAAAVKSEVNAAFELVNTNKADKSKVETDIAAAKSGAEAAAAADATSKANAAEAAAKKHADDLNSTLSGKVDAMDAAYKKADEEILGQIEDIVAAAVSVEAASGDKYVSVSQEGTKYTVSSKGIDDAISAAVNPISASVTGLTTRVDALDAAGDAEGNGKGRVTVLEEQVRALNAATHFEGKIEGDTFEAAIAASGKTFDAGDIVIYGNKEYIYDGAAWIELGDTTAEADRISQLETWKGTASQAIADNAANISANGGEINTLKGKVQTIEDTMATDDELKGVKEDLEGRIAPLEAAKTDHDGRIAALEGTANALGTTYVKVADYNSDKEALNNTVSGIDGRVGTLEGKMTTVEAGVAANLASINSINEAQGVQDEKIAALESFKDNLNVGITAVNGNADVAASTADGVASLSLNKASSVAKDSTLAVTSGAVYDALCWVEFN